MLKSSYDVIIIGGGVVGCMTARYLSRFQLDILLVEKRSDIGSVSSAANTALIHPGYNAVTGSMKAKMNLIANPMWNQLSEELNFSFNRCGDYVVAIGEDELSKLDTLFERGKSNGVTGMSFITRVEMRKREPLINPNVSGALFAETGGMCDPFGATLAAAENAVMNGVDIRTNTKFLDFIIENESIIGIKSSQGNFACRWAINAAGLYSDEIMHKADVRPGFKITPRKGEYLILDRAESELQSVYFPVPTDVSKGILATATIHGNTILGPTAREQDDREDKSNSVSGLEEVLSGGKKLIPSIQPRHVIAVFAGLRAAGNASSEASGVDYHHDFVIEIPKKVKGFVNIGGIESPGMTSSPAIALRVVNLLRDAGENLTEKADWKPIRPPRPHFREMSGLAREKLIEKDPLFGRIVCRCENVTEGEIIAEINSLVPALTYDAIKRRTWLGTGRCQGGFDLTRVTKILSQELGISPLEVSKKGNESRLLARPTKILGDDYEN